MLVSRITKNIILLEILTGLIVLGGLYLVSGEIEKKSGAKIKAIIEANQKTSEAVVKEEVKTEAAGQPKEIPDLNKPIIASANISGTVKDNSIDKIKNLIEDLKEDPNLYSNWLELGIYRKAIGDYDGAIEAWQYASYLLPNTAVPYSNLANIYIFELSDYKRGEEYLLKAINVAPSHIIYYEQAYEFYRFILKDAVKARKILEQGIAANPSNSIGLEKLLQEL